MNYFDQLLESYSRLKQRKLVLLEKGIAGGPECHAQLEKLAKEKPGGLESARAFFENPEPSMKPADMKTVNGRGEPYCFLATDGSKPHEKKTAVEGEKKPENDPDEFAVDTAGKKVTKITGGPVGNAFFASDTFDNFFREHCDATKKLINHFDGNQSSVMQQKIQGAGLETALNRAGNQIADSLGVTVEDVDVRVITAIEGTISGYSDLVALARTMENKETWTGYSEEKGEYLGASEDDTPDKTGTVGSYVTGGAGQSIERQLAVGQVGVITEDEGLRLTKLSADPDLISASLNSLNKFISLALESEDPEASIDCDQIPKLVRRKGANHLVLHANGDQTTGLIITESKPLAFAVDRIEEMCKSPIDKIPQGKYTAQTLNDFRGKALEAVNAGATFFHALMENQTLSDEEKDALIDEFSVYIQKELLADIKKFKYAMRWALDSEAATDLEGGYIRDTIRKLANQTKTPELFKEFLKKAYMLELPVIETMKADGAIPVGKKVGTGYKDDIVYTYINEADARAAAKRAGLTDKDVEHVSIADLKKVSSDSKGKSTLVDLFQKTHRSEDGSQLTNRSKVWAVGSGVKSYFEDGSLKVGEQSMDKSSRVNKGEVTADMAENFHEVTRERLNLEKGDTSVETYQKDVLDNITSTVDDVVTEATAKVVNGRVHPISPENLTTIMKERLSKLSYTASLQTNIGNLVHGLDLNNPKDRSELNDGLKRLLTTAQMVQDCNQKEETGKNKGEFTATAMMARKNLAYTFHMVGGVVTDSVVNTKILDDMRVRIGSHMRPLMEASDGILDGTWDIKLSSTGNTITVKDEKKRGLSLRKQRQKDSEGNYNPNLTLHANKEIMDDTATFIKDVQEPDATEESLMMVFLKSQLNLIENIISINQTS